MKDSRIIGLCGVILLLLVLICIHPEDVHSQESMLHNLILLQRDGQIEFSAQVEGCFTEKIRAGLFSGIPARMILLVRIEEERSVLWNREIVSRKIERILKYQSIKDQFVVDYLTEGGFQKIYQTLEEAQKAMTFLSRTNIITCSQMEKDHKYLLYIRATLELITLPRFLDYFLLKFYRLSTTTGWQVRELPLCDS